MTVAAGAFATSALSLIAFKEGRIFEPVAALAIAAVATLFAARATLTVERHGVRARLGFFGFPRRFIGLDEIKRAVAIRVRPVKQFGGWGSRVGYRSRGYIARGGQAVRIELLKGPAFVITVDNSRIAAERINAYVRERS